MPDKFVFVKEIRQQTKNNRSWRQIVTHEGESWNVFLDNVLEVGKCYVFTYERDAEHGWNNLQAIKPLVNVFQQKALKEVANRETIIRNYSVAFSYSKDLAIAGKIELGNIFEWADKIYKQFQDKADEEMNKIEKSDA